MVFSEDLGLIELHNFPVNEEFYYKKGFPGRKESWQLGIMVLQARKNLFSQSCFIEVDSDFGIILKR